MSNINLPGLAVFTTDATGSYVQLAHGDNRFRMVSMVIDRALRILESQRGLRALESLARRIFAVAADEPNIYPVDEDPQLVQVGYYMRLFVQRLRSAFPNVYLQHLGGEEARLDRRRWGNEDSTPRDFVARTAADLVLERLVVDNMALTQNGQDRNAYIFIMTITVAHEMGHCLLSYLSGPYLHHTPVEVGVPGDNCESGFYLERALFGSIVKMFSRAQDPYNVNQPGIAYTFPDMYLDSPGRMVSRTYINNFAAGNVTLPIQTSNTEAPISENGLVARGQFDMNDLRKQALWASRPAAATASAGTSNSAARRPGRLVTTDLTPLARRGPSGAVAATTAAQPRSGVARPAGPPVCSPVGGTGRALPATTTPPKGGAQTAHSTSTGARNTPQTARASTAAARAKPAPSQPAALAAAGTAASATSSRARTNPNPQSRS